MFKILMVDDWLGEYTSQYSGDYNNPIGEPILNKQSYWGRYDTMVNINMENMGKIPVLLVKQWLNYQ